MNPIKWLSDVLFGRPKAIRMDQAAGPNPYTEEAAVIMQAARNTMPGRLEEGQMREAPPEVMAQFSEEDLEADIPLSKAKKVAVRRSKEPTRKPNTRKNGKTKTHQQPIKAKKALKKAKARMRMRKK